MTVNIENLRTWTEALRSGAYDQVDGTLAKQEEGEKKIAYCCLGVGCVLAGVPHEKRAHVCDSDEEDWCESGGHGEVKHLFGAECATDLPPAEFHDWLGLANEGGVLGGDVYLDWPVEYQTLTTQGPKPSESYPGHRTQPLNQAAMTCANLNDSLRLSFPQIADMIDYFGVKSA